MGYAFSGSSQKIDFGDIADGWGTNKITFACYTRVASWAQTTGWFSKRTSSGSNDSYLFFMDGSSVYLQIPGVAYYRWSVSGFPTNEWVSLVCWYDGSLSSGGSDRAKLYMNGSLVSVAQVFNDGAGNIPNTTSPLQIGTANTDANYLTGSVAESAIWNIALSGTDAANYAAGTRPSSIEAANLEFYAPLESDSVDTITSTTGTVTGATLTDHPTMSAGATAPDPPTGLTLTVLGPTAIKLDWTAPVDDGGSEITGYLIEFESPVGDGFATLVADTGSTSTTYTHEALTYTTEYNYRVSAINAEGTSDPSTAADATTDADTPADVEDPVAVASGPYSVTLTWSAPLDDGGDPIVGYQIERETPHTVGFEIIVADTGSTDTEYEDEGPLQPSTTYNYRISAINGAGVGQSLIEVQVTTDPPPQPGSDVTSSDDLLAAGLISVDNGFALRYESHTIEFGTGSDVETAVPTNLTNIFVASAIRVDTGVEDGNSDRLFLKHAMNADVGVVTLSSGTVTITRHLTDASGELGAATWLVLLGGN